MIRMVLCGGKCGERGILSTKMVESLPLRRIRIGFLTPRLMSVRKPDSPSHGEEWVNFLLFIGWVV